MRFFRALRCQITRLLQKPLARAMLSRELCGLTELFFFGLRKTEDNLLRCFSQSGLREFYEKRRQHPHKYNFADLCK